MKKKIKVGDICIFQNRYGYPSLSGEQIEVTSLPDSVYPYYGVKFINKGNHQMAVMESEISSVA